MAALSQKQMRNLAEFMPEVLEVVKLSQKQVDKLMQMNRQMYLKQANVIEERRHIALRLQQVLFYTLHHVIILTSNPAVRRKACLLWNMLLRHVT